MYHADRVRLAERHSLAHALASPNPIRSDANSSSPLPGALRGRALGAGARAGQHPALHENERHDRHARRRPAEHGHLHAEGSAGTAADHLRPHAVRHRRRRRRPQHRVPRAGRRRLHLRLPGHPRPLQVARAVRDAARRRATRERKDPKAIDEATDAYDTIDWLVKNVPNNNGRVGMLGVSYAGWTTAMALLDPHPALKAASPQASPADMWLGDDFHHNGAFRLSYGFEYAAMMEDGQGRTTQFNFDKYDTYEWYLQLGPLSNVNAKYLHGKIPTWNDYVAHPNYDVFWQRQAIVPCLDAGDGADAQRRRLVGPGGFLRADHDLRALEKHDTKNLNFLVVGPWNHGGWNAADGPASSATSTSAAPTSKYFRDSIAGAVLRLLSQGQGHAQAPRGDRRSSPARTSGGRYDTLAAEGERDRAQAVLPRRTASSRFDAPPATERHAFDAYVSDPAQAGAVSPRGRFRPTYDPRGSAWSHVARRGPALRPRPARRPELGDRRRSTEDVTIAGDVMAKLFAATTGQRRRLDREADRRLSGDVPTDPKMGGYQLMVVERGVPRPLPQRASRSPKPLTPEQGRGVRDRPAHPELPFQKGHRIMVQVQSTWFPLIDRNPQTYVPNIFEAKDVGLPSGDEQGVPLAAGTRRISCCRW